MNSRNQLIHEEFDDQQQVIRSTPSFLLRSGNLVMLLLVLTLILVSGLIKSPNKLTIRITLTNPLPPIRLVSKNNGRVKNLAIKNDVKVKSGQILFTLENSAELEDVNKLENLIKDGRWSNEVGSINGKLKIGSLQNTFSDLIIKQNDLLMLQNGLVFKEKINSLDDQISQLHSLNELLSKRRNVLSQQNEISNLDFTRSKNLYKEKVISELDLEKVQIAFLSYSDQLEKINIEILSNQIRVTQLINEKSELIKAQNNELKSILLERDQALKKMESEIANWNQTYVFKAPVSGVVAFTGIQYENQFVAANSEVLSIVPDGNKEIIAKSFISGLGSGKVRKGSKVLIRLDGFPYQEFGSLIGSISAVSNVPGQFGYMLEIQVPSDLSTTFGKKINFSHEMQGDGLIILDDYSLLHRIFERLINIFEE